MSVQIVSKRDRPSSGWLLLNNRFLRDLVAYDRERRARL